MNDSHHPEVPNNREDPAVTTARREAIVVAVIFTVAMLYTVLYCYFQGYHRAPESLTFLFGFPDWVFWGILVPWGVCLGLSFWFGHTFVRDADLGPGDERSIEDELGADHD